MEQSKFRKLNVDLPKDPPVNELPWLIAGLLSALTFLVIVAYAFLKHKNLL